MLDPLDYHNHMVTDIDDSDGDMEVEDFSTDDDEEEEYEDGSTPPNQNGTPSIYPRGMPENLGGVLLQVGCDKYKEWSGLLKPARENLAVF